MKSFDRITLLVSFSAAAHLFSECARPAHCYETIPPVIGDVRPARPDTSTGGYCEAPREEPIPWAFTPLGALTWDPATQAERDVIYRAIRTCPRSNWSTTDLWAALAIHRTETMAGVPGGLLLAIWCWEAGMRLEAKGGGPVVGDHEAGVPRAFGPYQMHGWFWNWCGGTSQRATDVVWATNCYASRLLDQLPLAFERCGVEGAWQATEAWVANSPRYMPQGCKAKSKHWPVWEAQFQ